MLNAVFKRGREAAAGIDYGLSKTNHKGELRSVAPRVLYGDPEAVKAVVETMASSQRYTAGVLSFAEKTLPAELKRKLIDEHLRVSFPGLDPARVAAVYIEHGDEGFVELHYWIANLDLETGKRLNAYFHRADGQRLRLWCQSVNDRFNLADPNDPKRWRLSVQPKKDAPEGHKTLQAKLLAALEKMALAGVVKCRADIETALKKGGWQISRRTKTFISVSHAQLKKPIRLSGRMFGAAWNGSVAADALERLAREWVMARATRLRETAATLVARLEARAAYNQQRYRGTAPDDPLRRQLIALRDAPDEPPTHDAMAAVRARMAALQARLGGAPGAMQSLAGIGRTGLQRTAAPNALQPRRTNRPGDPCL